MKKHKHNENIDLENSQNNPFASKEAEKDASEQIADEEKNDEFKEKYEQLNNQYIRLAADFDNYRKRQAQERESLLKYGAEETMKKLIEVLDNFDRGLKAIEPIEDCQQVKDSYVLVCKQMYEILTKLGLEVIEAEGQEFDPNYHEAVMQ